MGELVEGFTMAFRRKFKPSKELIQLYDQESTFFKLKEYDNAEDCRMKAERFYNDE